MKDAPPLWLSHVHAIDQSMLLPNLSTDNIHRRSIDAARIAWPCYKRFRDNLWLMLGLIARKQYLDRLARARPGATVRVLPLSRTLRRVVFDAIAVSELVDSNTLHWTFDT